MTSSSSIVYIIRMVQATSAAEPAPPNLIKVGYTTQDPNDRRVQLNTGNPYKLQYVAAWKVKDGFGPQGEEVAHKRLNGLRAKPVYGGGQEWFSLPVGGYEGAVDLIQLALSGANLEPVRL